MLFSRFGLKCWVNFGVIYLEGGGFVSGKEQIWWGQVNN